MVDFQPHTLPGARSLLPGLWPSLCAVCRVRPPSPVLGPSYLGCGRLSVPTGRLPSLPGARSLLPGLWPSLCADRPSAVPPRCSVPPTWAVAVSLCRPAVCRVRPPSPVLGPSYLGCGRLSVPTGRLPSLPGARSLLPGLWPSLCAGRPSAV